MSAREESQIQYFEFDLLDFEGLFFVLDVVWAVSTIDGSPDRTYARHLSCVAMFVRFPFLLSAFPPTRKIGPMARFIDRRGDSFWLLCSSPVCVEGGRGLGNGQDS